MQKYIDSIDERETVKSLILYSDSCLGQNKNKIVLAAIQNALLMSKNLKTIQMNYLLPGYTEMTVDSIHATIENSCIDITVWAPSQWLKICQLARKDPGPYQVEGLTHEDIKNYEELTEKYFKGNLVGKISKIRVATFKKSTQMWWSSNTACNMMQKKSPYKFIQNRNNSIQNINQSFFQSYHKSKI